MSGPTRRHVLDDLGRWVIPGDPSIAPDGGRVVYSVRSADVDADENVHSLWWVGTDGAPATTLTTGRADLAPRYSPDGATIAFLRAVDGPPQLWALPVAGGEPERLTELPAGAGVPVWSPDGTKIAFTAPVDTAGAAGATAPLRTERVIFKVDGAGRDAGLRQQVHVLDVADRSVRQVTRGDFHAGLPAWSPDGTRIAFADLLAGDADLSGESGAHVVDVETGESRPAGPQQGTVTAVTWQGEDLLLVATPDTQVRNQVLVRLSPDGTATELTRELDRNVMAGGNSAYPGALPQFVDDDVLFCLRDNGYTHLYRLGADGVTPLVAGTHLVGGLSVAGDVAAVVVTTPEAVTEIALLDLTSGELRTLTAHGDVFADVAPFVTEERSFTISDGTLVHGWLLRDPAVTGPAPLLLDVHGGPHNAWHGARDPIHLYHQVLVARGWAVLTLNPRGSDGYGEEFMRAIVGGWGETDLPDVLEPVDTLVAEGIADPEKLALSGYSYGGYQACNLPGRTDRFAAVVAGGVVCDLVSMAGTSDVGSLLARAEIGVAYWDDPARTAELSPLTRIAAVTSPTLVLHGAADERCPVGQAEQWYAALRTRGVPTELVLYPGGAHLFILDGPPSHRVDYNRRLVDWVVRHTGAAIPAPLDAGHWQRRLTVLAQEFGIVGAALAIRHGDELAEAAHGVLNTRTGQRATPDSIFQIGSVSKVYTATAAMRLVADGTLELDAPVLDVLPELRLGDAEVAKKVTLRHLLTHTSGIDGDVFTDTGRGDDCVAKYVDGLAEVAQNHPIGATFSYCNSGFVLAGRMIEQVTGKTWDEAIRELVFTPLGLETSMTLPEEALLHGAACGHEKGTPVPQWVLPRSAGPAGLVLSTARDVAAFGMGHLDDTLLPAAVRAEMQAVQTALPDTHTLADSWGLGWFRNDWDGREVIGHDGNTIGQSAFLRVLPEAGLSVALLTNGGPARDLFQALYGEIFAALAGVRVPAPLTPPAGPVQVDITPHLGRYERVGALTEVFAGEDGPRLRLTATGPLAALRPDPVMEFSLVPVSQDLYVTRQPGDRSWTPVTFYRLADGSPYVHFGVRANPKVGES